MVKSGFALRQFFKYFTVEEAWASVVRKNLTSRGPWHDYMSSFIVTSFPFLFYHFVIFDGK